MKKKLFIFICDSYFIQETDAPILDALGLIDGEDFDSYGAGGSDIIFFASEDEPYAAAENLLVFTGTFHGDIDKAINYAKKIKDINPAAKIYFRSSTDVCTDPVFDGYINKANSKQFNQVIRDFVENVRQAA